MKQLLTLIVISIAIISVIIVTNSYNNQREVGDSSPADSRIPTTSDERRQLEELFLRYAVQPELRPYSHIEVATLYNIATSTFGGENFLNLSLFPGQPLKNGGIRSEISIDYPYQENDIVEYMWQFKIPANFESDAPDNRWWILADWHDQPDLKRGETWDSYESQTTPIIFGYGIEDGVDMISLSTGSRTTTEGVQFHGLVPIKREVWHSLRVIVSWSQSDSGRVTVYVDGSAEPAFDIVGENMVNGYQHYMKIGQYRHPGIQATSTISIKNISIQTLRSNSDIIE